MNFLNGSLFIFAILLFVKLTFKAFSFSAEFFQIGIAKKQLGDGTKYKEIARKNGIANPNRIYPGQVLKL